MERRRVFIAHKDQSFIRKVRHVLTGAGYNVIDTAVDTGSALRRIRTLKPDLTIIDLDLPPMGGLQLAGIIDEARLSAVILIAGNTSVDQDIAFPFISKPITKSTLLQSINLVIIDQQRIKKLEREIDKLKGTLESRKYIERAKGILMRNLGLTEQEAFRRIQRESMDKGLPMKDIARAIITAHDITE